MILASVHGVHMSLARSHRDFEAQQGFGVLTWWQVSSRAVHTNTPDTPRANALVRKSWGGPCEPLSTRSICGPAATVGIAGGGLGGSQVADTRGAPAVFRNPDAFLICRSQQRSEDPGQAPVGV